MQQPQVITLSHKKYATGLFWQPVGSGHTPRNYAYILSKHINERVSLFVEYRSMVGLGSGRLGHRTGMPSLAAEVMESFTEYSSFLAAFSIGDAFWIVAARNGVIVADKLFYNEELAKSNFEEIMNMTDWAALIAPGSWAKPRAIETKIEDIVLPNIKNGMKSISHFAGNVFTFLLAFVFLFGLFQTFKTPIMKIVAPQRPKIAMMDSKLAEEYKKRMEEKSAELDKEFNIKKSEPVRLVMPYDDMPDFSEHTKLCWQAIGFLMQPIPGWSQTVVSCDGNKATTTLKRDFGTLYDFYEVGDKLMPGVVSEEISDSEIKLTVDLPKMTKVSSLSELDADSVARAIYSLFQRANMEVEIDKDSEEISAGNLSAKVNFVFVSAESKLTPLEFMSVFSDMEGVSIQSIKWDNEKREWNYEVRIYVK